jgi:hypothetical protein
MTQGFQYRPTQHRSCPALLAMAATLCWVIPASGWSPCSDDMDQIAQETSAQDALLGRDNDAMQKFYLFRSCWEGACNRMGKLRISWPPQPIPQVFEPAAL